MCHEGSAPSLHVGVEIDTYGEHTGSIRYEITEPDWTGTSHRKVIERLREKDTGDPTTLRDFLNWGFGRYKANSRLVVVWNHGTGFRSVRRNIGYDDFGSSLDMPEVEEAFSDAGISRTNRLQIVGFDACLMNMVEIVHHFAPQVEIIVGSQQTEPADGWPYDKVLYQAKQAQCSEDFAKGIVDEYIDDYRRRGISNVTQSAIRTSETYAVINALDALGNALLTNFNTFESQLRSIRMRAQTFEMADYVDLIHTVTLIANQINDIDVGSAARDVIDTAKKSVISYGYHGDSISNANGLSIWFPASQWVYFNNRAKYMKLSCNSNQFGWTSFLDAYHL